MCHIHNDFENYKNDLKAKSLFPKTPYAELGRGGCQMLNSKMVVK